MLSGMRRLHFLSRVRGLAPNDLGRGLLLFAAFLLVSHAVPHAEDAQHSHCCILCHSVRSAPTLTERSDALSLGHTISLEPVKIEVERLHSVESIPIALVPRAPPSL